MLHQIRHALVFLTFGLLLTACNHFVETDCFTTCDQQVIINAEEYQNAPNDELEIINMQFEGDCLIIKFQSSGCDGNSWEIKLVDSEAIMESYPVQRNLRLSLKNQEPCDALIIKEVAFNISSLKLDEYDKIKLNITNSGDQLLYFY